MDEETRSRFGTLESWIDALRSAEGFYPGAEGFRIGPVRLFVQAVDGDYHIHQREEDGTESDLTGAKSLQGIPLSATAPTAAQVWAYDADLDEWVLASSAAPGEHALGGAAHTTDTLAHLNAKVSDATLDDSGDSRTPSAHTVASHSDTTATGAELETLTDGSDADALHDHSQFASAAEAVAAVEAANPLDMANAIQVDTITEHTGNAGITLDGVTCKDDAVEVDALRGLKESGGQALNMGAVADGQFLKRDGTDIVGAAGGGGQDLATDTLWAAAGDLVKGTGDDAADILSAGASGTFLRIDGSIPYWDAPGIADTNPVVMDGSHNDDEYVRLTAAGIEGRTAGEAKTDLGFITDVVDDATPQLGGALDGQGEDLNNLGVIFLTEQATAEADVAGKGQIWVKTATPNELWFTDDAGTDVQLGAGGGAGASTALDNLASVAINESLISDTDSTDDLGSSSKYWAKAYVDDLYLSGVLGLKGTVPNASYWANLSPTAPIEFSGELVALRIYPTALKMTAPTGFTGIFGNAAILLDNGVNPTARSSGLSFQAYPMAGSGSGAHTVGKFVGAHIRSGAMAVGDGQSITATDIWGLEIEAPLLNAIMDGVVEVTNYVAANFAAINSALIVNGYQLRLGNIENATTANIIIEAGPATPYMRLEGGAAPAGVNSKSIVNFGGTLYRLTRNAGTGAVETAAI